MRKLLPLLLLVAASILRFVNLGYSEFQGDEIRALCDPKVNLWEFLLSQKKGPVQFLITYATRGLTNYDELLTRLPFALAGLLAVLVIYLLVKELFGRRVALISAFLFSVNGLFVAFSRIVQYQSPAYLFYLLGLYLAILLFTRGRRLFLYLSAVSLAMGFLSHYDAVFVIPLVSWFVFRWVRERDPRSRLVDALTALALFAALVSLFYLPFFANSSFTSVTSAYLFERVSGTNSKVTDVWVTYSVYNPFLSVYLLLGLAAIGAALGRLKTLPIVAWFVLNFLVFGVLVAVPGTHIYNYVIPLCILAGYGAVRLFEIVRQKVVRVVVLGFLALCLAFLYYQSFLLFVDHSPEYPWFEKKVLLWSASMPSTKYNLSLFGFPYFRHLREVGEYLDTQDSLAELDSNEGTRVLRYYIKPDINPSVEQGAYIYVYGAQSLVKHRAAKVGSRSPVKSYYNGEQVVSEVYLFD